MRFSFFNKYDTIHYYIIFCIQFDQLLLFRNLNFIYIFKYDIILFMLLELIILNIIMISDNVAFFFFISGIGTLYVLSFFLLWPILGGYQYYYSFQGINSWHVDFFNWSFVYYIINLCSYCHYFFITTFFAFNSYFSSPLRWIPTRIIAIQPFYLYMYLWLYISL